MAVLPCFTVEYDVVLVHVSVFKFCQLPSKMLLLIHYMLVVDTSDLYATVNNTWLFLYALAATELDFLSPLLLKVYCKFAR